MKSQKKNQNLKNSVQTSPFFFSDLFFFFHHFFLFTFSFFEFQKRYNLKNFPTNISEQLMTYSRTNPEFPKKGFCPTFIGWFENPKPHGFEESI